MKKYLTLNASNILLATVLALLVSFNLVAAEEAVMFGVIGAVTDTIKVPSISSFVSNVTTTISLVRGLTYDKIILLFSDAGDQGKISNIKVDLNGKTIRTYKDAKVLAAENVYFGDPQTNGKLILNFDQTWLRNLNEIKSLGIGTQSGVATFNISFDCGDNIAGTLKAWAQVSEPKPLGTIMIKRDFSHNLIQGVNDLSGFPRQGRLILANFINSANNNITNLEVRRANQTIFDLTAPLMLDDVKKAYPRPRKVTTLDLPKYLPYDACLDGSLSGAVNLSRDVADDFRFRLTAAEADAGFNYSLYTLNNLQNA